MPTRISTPKRKPPPKKTSKSRGSQGAGSSAQPVTPVVAPDVAQRFPIVGIGASAGGLEALQSFLAHVPSEPGIAFVIVTHLAPDQVSLLPELLQRHTRMPVQKAQDGMKVEPNCVYVNTPAHDLAAGQRRSRLAATAAGPDAVHRAHAARPAARSDPATATDAGSDGRPPASAFQRGARFAPAN